MESFGNNGFRDASKCINTKKKSPTIQLDLKKEKKNLHNNEISVHYQSIKSLFQTHQVLRHIKTNENELK